MTFVKHSKLFNCFFYSETGPQKVFGKSILKTRLFKLSKYRFFNGRKNGYFPKGLAHEKLQHLLDLKKNRFFNGRKIGVFQGGKP